MTDDTDANNENNFSFRMFDLYRRFVEVLILRPDFLLEFKSGHPSEGVCRDVIKKVFKNRQSEVKTDRWLKYLNQNAKTIADHAENLPNVWSYAIEYTDQCIKLIKKYLRSNKIDLKKVFDIKKLAQDIGKFMHTTPNKVQLQAITDYLMNDLNNPKNTILSQLSWKKSKKKAKKASEKSKDLKVNDSIKTALEEIFDESTWIDKDEDCQTIFDQKKAEIQKLLQEGNAKSQNELLHIEDNTKSSLEESIQEVVKEKSFFCEDEEDIEIDIESPEYKINESLIDYVNKSINYRKGLKRHGNDTGYHQEYVKKICIPKDCNQQDFQKDQNLPINYRKNEESSENEKVLSVTFLEDAKDKTEEENKNLKLNKKIMTLNENFDLKSRKNNLNPLKMTYHDAYQLMESIMAFCVLKNEISLEEFLILRRTRDKMHWQSLKDELKENQ